MRLLFFLILGRTAADAGWAIFPVLSLIGAGMLLYFLLRFHADDRAKPRGKKTGAFQNGVLLFERRHRLPPVETISNPVELDAKRTSGSDTKFAISLLLFSLTLFLVPRAGAQEKTSATPDAETIRALRQELQALRSQLDLLTTRISTLEKLSGNSNQAPASASTPDASQPVTGSAAASSTPSTAVVPKFSGSETEGFLRGTTFNVLLDGYYEYNFNSPVGRVNLLRAYDVSSNSFSLNQAAIVIEHAPNLEEGRRLGLRLDLQYGQATETLQGNGANELRPQVYRNLFQAYGTYIAPVGTGLTIDFGKWASALGFENNFTKDQFNYSRSFLFNFLPFYHMGFRTSYSFTPKANLTYWLVNGAQQTEDFNGFKSQAFIFTLKPATALTWNINYYFGQEQRDVVANLNPGIPTEPTQPGLPVIPIVPAPNGREHIFDTYASWNVTPRLTFAGEFDYVINRFNSTSAPMHVIGGALYLHQELTARTALSARAEYLSDRGGLFSGTTQALKESTLTFDYRLGDGLLARWEWRRDFSNRPFFLSSEPGAFKKDQNTASLGLVWWFGQKQGAW
jgi:Putative beta-barrel porin-2, OmpL-like. bbp2